MIYDSSIFSNVRFFLAGFTSQQHLEVKSKLLSAGGVYVEEYHPDCTHVIVENIVLDDPICVAARRDGKTLVTSLWVDYSFDYGEPADVNHILYRPPKELNGIPGANELLMSLTGFHGVDRDDIKILVELMGAQFSKAMAANRVTHLVCYKFEGEKYEMAKRVGFTKLVNRYWIEDCLEAWRLLPEENYCKSTFEVEMEMEAEVKDSDDENEDVIGRKTSGITNLKTNIGEAHNHSVLASKMSIPPMQQRLSNNASSNDRKLLKSDMQTESIDANKSEKQPSLDNRNLSQMGGKSENFNAQNAKSSQIESGLLSSPGNAKNLSNFYAKPSFNFSRKTPVKTSPQSKTTAGEDGKSDGRPTDENIIDEVPNFNLETDTEEAASGGFGGSSFERLTDPDAGKHSPLNSKEHARRFSHSLQLAGEVTCQPRKEERSLAEKVIADVYTSNVGPDQGKTALPPGISSAEAGLLDVKDPGSMLPRKRTAGSNVSDTTPKSQKLASSASKRVDAAEPKIRLNNSLRKTISGALKSGNQVGNESAGPSPNLSSSKSSANNAAHSRSSHFDMLPGSKATNIDPLTSPNTNSRSPSVGDGNDKGQLQNLCKNVADSPGINDLEAVKTGSPKLNSDDPNGTSVSKPTRKKMVARKTLGSRPKARKTKADAQGSSVRRSSIPDDSAIDSVVQENREELAPSSAADKVLPSTSVNESVSLGAKHHLNSSTEINHNAEILEATEAPSELDMRNEKSQTAGQSHLVKSKTREAYSELLHQTDDAKVNNSASKKAYNQEMPVTETVDMEQNLVEQNKGKGVKAKKKNLHAPKEAAKDADKGEDGKSSSGMKEPVVGAAAKKSRGTLLNKSKRSVDVENENNLVCNGQLAKKGVNCSGRLASNEKRGTPLLNKSEGPAEEQKKTELEFDGDKGQSDGTKLSVEHVASSNMTQGDVEDKNKNDPGVCSDQGVSKVAKCPQKLAGKKRRGTVLLKKSGGVDEVEKENAPVNEREQHNGELASAFNISDKPMDDDKENGPALGNNKGTKNGKRAGNFARKKRRGTLVLNPNDEQVDEGKMNKSDEDKSKGGTLTEKLISKTNKVGAANLISLNNHKSEEVKKQSACFILSGHRLQRKEFQKLIKHLKGKVCRDTHQWSYQASHFIVPDPIRRTEKFFAAAASGSWILKTDYLTACSQAGKFLPEEPYEWHKNGLSEDGAIGLEAPRKWRLLRERTGHGAFYGMRVVIYGECIAPPLDTLKRAVKAGDGTILATSPPYTRFLVSGIDFAIISPGMPRVDKWVQEFLSHQIPCVLADYLVEYVCKPGYSLDRHVLYNTHEWASKSFSKLLSLSEEVVVDAVTTPDDQDTDDLACQVCGSTDRGEVMLVCGDEAGSSGCGIGTHIDCCDPPLEDIPEDDWFCPTCSESVN